MQKIVLRWLFVIYLILLTWLIVFKFGQVFWMPIENLPFYANLIPFAQTGGWHEVVDNVLVFVPYGLLLAAIAKKSTFAKQLLFIFVTSFLYETLQFVFRIGSADVTDLITNTLGGLIGLVAYRLSCKIIKGKRTDDLIVIVGGLVLLVFLAMLLRRGLV